MVTRDKFYQPISQQYGFKEDDKLGGNNPYGFSKAALVTNSWRKSFFEGNIVISTARAGNVIGEGDCANDRIIPNIVDSLLREITLKLRYPNTIRPWQNVLDLL